VQSVLRPAGPAAEHIAGLWWILLGVCAAIYVVFAAAALYAATHRGARPRPADAARESRRVLIGGALLPAVIVLCLFGFTLATLRALAPAAGQPRLTIDVSGQRWWWDVRYVGAEVITANEIHLPVGETVAVRLRSDNVIHSFWVPALSGKLDLVPGRTNTLRLRADRPGTYRGQCAEYCGLQHARMAFLVVAESRAEFDAWLVRQQQPAPTPIDPTLAVGQAVFVQHCGQCHTVRGTGAGGTTGPDLTHIASRRTLAAGTLPNTSAHLSTWIAHAQSVKPGSLMPDIALEPTELRHIHAYLMSLR
jgi:cytochrome c oxidase subunit 2